MTENCRKHGWRSGLQKALRGGHLTKPLRLVVTLALARQRNGELSLHIIDGEAVDVGGWLEAARAMGSAGLAQRMGVTVRQAQRILAGQGSQEAMVALASRVPLEPATVDG